MHTIHPDCEKILLTEEQIRRRVTEVASKVNCDLAGKRPVAVGILKGSIIFYADFIRCISLPLELDFMAVSSYGSGATSSGKLKIKKDLDGDIKGRDVIVIEDIIDSGFTLACLKKLVPKRLQVDRVIGFRLNFHPVPFCRRLDSHGSQVIVSKQFRSPLLGKEHPGKIEQNTLVFEQSLILDREAIHGSQRRHIQTALDFDLATFGIEPSERVEQTLHENNIPLLDEQKCGIGSHCQV